ncbi:MAG: hypothetical protein KAV87_56595, partial [Desulfobacteraceae bacterium]|nr:hypothetical protein [Desulfobacteraceae bacterium]
DFPLAKKVVLTPGTGGIDVDSRLIYPRMHIAGMDLAGSIAVVGIWAEAAVFFPEKVTMTTDSTALGGGIVESTALDNKPYIKYVVGLDYTFRNGIYVNAQYLYGFIHERGVDNLEDYFMFGMEWKLLNDRIKISPINGGVEIKDFENIRNNYAVMLFPEFTFYPVDSAEIVIGALFIEGKNTTTFGRVKDNDEIFLKIKYSF